MYVALSRVRGRENAKVTGFKEKYASSDMDVMRFHGLSDGDGGEVDRLEKISGREQ